MTKTRELAHMIPSYADAALIYSQNNRKYFTGFVSSLGYLLVTKRDTYLLLIFVMLRPQGLLQRTARLFSSESLMIA